jgi:hypothetical protein
MNFLILGKAGHSPYNYRGVRRPIPGYIGDLEETDPVNQHFFWSTSKYDDGYLHDLVKAKELVDAYAQLPSPQIFEVIQITHDEEVEISGDFLGYDIANYNYSVLSDGMNYCIDDSDIIRPLLCLIEDHFKPHLNGNFLFSERLQASNCLKCMLALNNLAPEAELWELHHPSAKLKVTGVYKLYKPSVDTE